MSAIDSCVVEGELSQRWTFGAKIGGGGFARVLEAVDRNGVNHAAKFVRKEPGAGRELLLAELDNVRNVVPVVDCGEVGDDYVLVMPLAELSLREHLDQNAPLSQPEAIKILTDVATALTDLDGRVVHRDLKPENVLLWNGSWCLADFGIARYADAATEAGETRKGVMTGAYAAPEQWRHERATAATDIYAVGVMAYELLEGERPFKGTVEDLRESHLHSDPPGLTVGPVLAALVEECLFKAPGARPSAQNLLAKLRRALEQAADPRWARLASVNHAEVQRRAAQVAVTVREQAELTRRQGLFVAGTASWSRISDQFHGIINDYLGTAVLTVFRDKHWVVELAGAKFGLSYPEFEETDNPEIPFDIIATSTLSVLGREHPQGHQGWRGRSHSLYFADAMVEGQYAWFEIAFMDTPMVTRTRARAQEPFALNDLGDRDLHHALGRVMGSKQVAWDVTQIDPSDCTDFVQRWLDWFASAAEGDLHRPNRMPEQSISRRWRR